MKISEFKVFKKSDHLSDNNEYQKEIKSIFEIIDLDVARTYFKFNIEQTRTVSSNSILNDYILIIL